VTGRRIGAVLIAVALIAGALLLRRTVLDDDADAFPGPSATTPPTSEPATPAASLVCITELAAACQAIRAEHADLAVTIEGAGTTLDRLAELPDGEPSPLWLTIQPFPAMLEVLRSNARLDPVAATTDTVATTRLAVAAPADGRADVLVAACENEPLWRCIGDHAGDPWTELGGQAAWNTVRPSLGAVDVHAVALASFAAAVAGYFGTPDIRAQMWQADPAFTPWVNRLAGAVSTSALSAGTPLATMAVRPPLDLAATTDAEVVEIAGPGGDRFALNYPDPSMWVEAVLAVPGRTAAPDGLVDDLTAAATAEGWDAPAAVPQPLPTESTMLALRARWQELS
jgi:hypothetical protein